MPVQWLTVSRVSGHLLQWCFTWTDSVEKERILKTKTISRDGKWIVMFTLYKSVVGSKDWKTRTQTMAATAGSTVLTLVSSVAVQPKMQLTITVKSCTAATNVLISTTWKTTPTFPIQEWITFFIDRVLSASILMTSVSVFFSIFARNATYGQKVTPF